MYKLCSSLGLSSSLKVSEALQYIEFLKMFWYSFTYFPFNVVVM